MEGRLHPPGCQMLLLKNPDIIYNIIGRAPHARTSEGRKALFFLAGGSAGQASLKVRARCIAWCTHIARTVHLSPVVVFRPVKREAGVDIDGER